MPPIIFHHGCYVTHQTASTQHTCFLPPCSISPQPWLSLIPIQPVPLHTPPFCVSWREGSVGNSSSPPSSEELGSEQGCRVCARRKWENVILRPGLRSQSLLCPVKSYPPVCVGRWPVVLWTLTDSYWGPAYPGIYFQSKFTKKPKICPYAAVCICHCPF